MISQSLYTHSWNLVKSTGSPGKRVAAFRIGSVLIESMLWLEICDIA